MELRVFINMIKYLFLSLLVRLISAVVPGVLYLQRDEAFMTSHPDGFGLNFTVTLGSFDVPCIIGGARYVAKTGDCACINDHHIVDDGTWEVCAFHCHHNDTMHKIKYQLDGLTEDFPL